MLRIATLSHYIDFESLVNEIVEFSSLRGSGGLRMFLVQVVSVAAVSGSVALVCVGAGACGLREPTSHKFSTFVGSGEGNVWSTWELVGTSTYKAQKGAVATVKNQEQCAS